MTMIFYFLIHPCPKRNIVIKSTIDEPYLAPTKTLSIFENSVASLPLSQEIPISVGFFIQSLKYEKFTDSGCSRRLIPPIETNSAFTTQLPKGSEVPMSESKYSPICIPNLTLKASSV